MLKFAVQTIFWTIAFNHCCFAGVYPAPVIGINADVTLHIGSEEAGSKMYQGHIDYMTDGKKNVSYQVITIYAENDRLKVWEFFFPVCIIISLIV